MTPPVRRREFRIPIGRLIERLEEAYRSGRLDLPIPLYAEVLCVLFPEEFPPDLAAIPTDTPPHSEERMEVYRERVERMFSLFHEGDTR